MYDGSVPRLFDFPLDRRRIPLGLPRQIPRNQQASPITYGPRPSSNQSQALEKFYGADPPSFPRGPDAKVCDELQEAGRACLTLPVPFSGAGKPSYWHILLVVTHLGLFMTRCFSGPALAASKDAAGQGSSERKKLRVLFSFFLALG